MTSRKPPSAAFWLTVALVAVLVAYPLSIGPAAWLVSQDWRPDWAGPIYYWTYVPIIWVYENAPLPIHDAMKWYVDLWT